MNAAFTVSNSFPGGTGVTSTWAPLLLPPGQGGSSSSSPPEPIVPASFFISAVVVVVTTACGNQPEEGAVDWLMATRALSPLCCCPSSTAASLIGS
jgi:hypothetical protein